MELALGIFRNGSVAMLLLVCSDLLSAKDVEPDGVVILAMARAAAGGETGASAETLVLSGHGAKGKVRISAISKGRPMFLAGFDGSATWTEKGGMPKAEADAY
jgi:hypothetical protein